MRIRVLLAGLFLVVIAVSSAEAQAPRLIRSLSGPSGKTVGPDFVIDAPRTRFVYPQDGSLTVYFEWEFVPGDHELVATWTRPSGQVASVSAPVHIQTTSNELKSYWTFDIGPALENGAWTVTVRIDGQPAGSHAFEIAGASAGGHITLDQVFKTYGASVVMVRQLDDAGRPLDSSSGFVIGRNAIATAFQAIDATVSVDVEFADGRRAPVTGVWAWSRLDDWAILRVDTQGLAPLPRGDAPPVGARLAVFDSDGGTRVVMPLNVGAVSASAGRANRIRFSPAVTPQAVGGPLIDEYGKVVGVLGGTMTPGLRGTQPGLARSMPWLITSYSTGLVVSELPATLPAAAASFDDLNRVGALTPRVSPMPEFVLGGTTAQLPKDAADRMIRDVSEFSARADTTVTVYSFWAKKSKNSKGQLGVTIFDADNHVRGSIPAKTINLGSDERRFSASWSPKGLTPGFYRIDTSWDGKPVWRTYVRVTE